jgi:hypothetical protein
MGKTIFAAVIAAVLASVATVLVMGALSADRSAADIDARKLAEDVRKVERERIERRIADLEKRPVAAPRVERRAAEEAASAAPATGAPPPPLAPDGSPYVSRAEMEAFARKLASSYFPAATGDAAVHKPVEKKSLEEIARDMNLSAGEEANLRNILRESEEEMVRSLFGDKPMDDIKREVKDAKDDPDKQAALMQGVVQHGIANVGKLMTSEKRMKKRVESVLGAEKAATFLATPRKPVIDSDLEEVMRDFK